MNIDRMQDATCEYLMNLPLCTRVHVLEQVLGMEVSCEGDVFRRRGSIWPAQQMEELTRYYVLWMRVDESQKVWNYMQNSHK